MTLELAHRPGSDSPAPVLPAPTPLPPLQLEPTEPQPANGTGGEHSHYPPQPAPSSAPPPPVAAAPAAAPAANGDSDSSAGAVTASSHEPKDHASAPHAKKTLTQYIAANPTHTVGMAKRRVFPRPNPIARLAHRFQVKHSVIDGMTPEELADWQSRGAELRRKAGWRLADEDAEGVVVSELFWNMYLSILPTTKRDPLAGMCAPDLLGSTTTMPLSIISVIPDIMQHYRDVIVRAKEEIFLATNYWQPSDSVNTVSGALRDLSRKVVEAKRPKVIVKIMYDRGSLEQIWNAHAPVKSSGWTPLDLPAKEDIPGLDLEVINFHKMLLGTFHCKFLIVDRKVVLLNSNNIQDRPNLEMMTHLEGPIVDSFYDIALHSWHNKLEPPLPRIDKPYDPPRDPKTGEIRYLFQDRNPYFSDIEIMKAARAARMLLRRQAQDLDDERARSGAESAHPTRDRLYEAVRQVIANQRQNISHTQEEFALRSANAMTQIRDFGERFGFGSRPGSRRTSATDLTKLARSEYQDSETAAITAANARNTAPSVSAPTSPSLHGIPLKTKASFTPSHARFSVGDTTDDDNLNSPARTEDTTHVDSIPPLSLHGDADSKQESVSTVTDSPFQTVTEMPTVKEDVAAEHAAPAAAVPDTSRSGRPVLHLATGVRTPGQSATRTPIRTGARTPSRNYYDDSPLPSGAATPTYRPKVSIDEPIPDGAGSKRLFKLSKRFNAGALSEAWATVDDSDDIDTFRPHVVHSPHTPFPVAMTCRRPHGMPGHQDIRNPQNAAWLAGFRYAKKRVLIQTPTLNARPIVRAIKQTCRRGVEVVLLLDLGFNDQGESIPFQGGTNEQVVDRLYKKLGAEGKSKHLKVYWYTGKDQVRPLNAVKKQRNCHIKFASFDDEVMCLGNGNMDTQSVFHSSEVNVILDSKQQTKEMMDTLFTNQNTMQYGGVEADGVWRDDEGHTLDHYGATGGGGFMSGMSAFMRFAKTAAK